MTSSLASRGRERETTLPLSLSLSLKQRAACHLERSARNARVAKDLLLERDKNGFHVTSLGAADLSVRIASAPTTATATINATQSTAGWRSVQGAGSAYPAFGVSVPRPAEAAASRSAGLTTRVIS